MSTFCLVYIAVYYIITLYILSQVGLLQTGWLSCTFDTSYLAPENRKTKYMKQAECMVCMCEAEKSRIEKIPQRNFFSLIQIIFMWYCVKKKKKVSISQNHVRKWKLICRSSSTERRVTAILPLYFNIELPKLFAWEKIPQSSIVVSRNWKLRFQGFFLVQFGAKFRTHSQSHQHSIFPNFQANFPQNLV